MARRRAAARRRKRRNVYFGPNSWTRAVPDIGKRGVHTATEVKWIAFAQLADYADGKTVDSRTGRVKPFTEAVWRGRMRVLEQLAEKYGGKRAVKLIEEYKERLEKAKSWRSKLRILHEAARKLGISKSLAERIIRRVKQ